MLNLKQPIRDKRTLCKVQVFIRDLKEHACLIVEQNKDGTYHQEWFNEQDMDYYFENYLIEKE